MKTYFGRRHTDGTVKVSVRDSDQTVRPLRHIFVHSATGFEWGYGGSGPADLALSILADYFEEHPTPSELYQGEFETMVRIRSLQYHQRFKWEFIAQADRLSWEISEEAVDQFIERERRKERPDPA